MHARSVNLTSRVKLTLPNAARKATTYNKTPSYVFHVVMQAKSCATARVMRTSAANGLWGKCAKRWHERCEFGIERRGKMKQFTMKCLGAAAVTAASALSPVSAFAGTAFLFLSEIDSGHSVCNPLCTSNFSSSAPIGLSSTTYTSANGLTSITAAGLVGPNPITSFVTSNVAVEFDLGIADTYTVHGSATGPFSITTTFGATGTMSTVPSGPFNVLFAGNANVKIGTYSTQILDFPSGSITYPTVTSFDASSQATTGGITLTTAGSVPVNISATYTKNNVSVGDVFDIAYMLTSAFAKGTIDLSHTATISFLLPEGVYLTSELGSVFGDVPTSTPLPAALPLFATGLGALGLLGWRRKKKAAALAA